MKVLSGIGVRIAIVGVIALVGFVFRDRIAGHAGELQVGDCFDDPAEVEDIGDVQHHPCNEPHTGEVFYIADHPAPDDGADLTEAQLAQFAGTQCVAAFTAYTGLAIESQAELDFSIFYPGPEAWADGERKMTCYLVRLDGGPMTQSYQATAR